MVVHGSCCYKSEANRWNAKKKHLARIPVEMLQKDTVFDLIGLGFGPANIAIACALTEDWENQKVC